MTRRLCKDRVPDHAASAVPFPPVGTVFRLLSVGCKHQRLEALLGHHHVPGPNVEVSWPWAMFNLLVVLQCLLRGRQSILANVPRLRCADPQVSRSV